MKKNLEVEKLQLEFEIESLLRQHGTFESLQLQSQQKLEAIGRERDNKTAKLSPLHAQNSQLLVGAEKNDQDTTRCTIPYQQRARRTSREQSSIMTIRKSTSPCTSIIRPNMPINLPGYLPSSSRSRRVRTTGNESGPMVAVATL
jgi:hypothetical protein